MAEVKPWSDAEGRTLRELHAAGQSLGGIAKQMKRSRATISKRAADAGLSFDRRATEVATQAAKVDAKARQVTLEQDLLGDVEQARLRLSQVETPRDFQAIGQGFDAVVRAYANFKRTVPDDGGFGEARGFVDRILFALEFALLERDEVLLNPLGIADPETGEIVLAHTIREAWNLRQAQIRGLAKERRLA